MKHNNITFCLKIPYFTINAVLHTHPLKFFNLVIVHTLDFWYMIKNKLKFKIPYNLLNRQMILLKEFGNIISI